MAQRTEQHRLRDSQRSAHLMSHSHLRGCAAARHPPAYLPPRRPPARLPSTHRPALASLACRELPPSDLNERQLRLLARSRSASGVEELQSAAATGAVQGLSEQQELEEDWEQEEEAEGQGPSAPRAAGGPQEEGGREQQAGMAAVGGLAWEPQVGYAQLQPQPLQQQQHAVAAQQQQYLPQAQQGYAGQAGYPQAGYAHQPQQQYLSQYQQPQYPLAQGYPQQQQQQQQLFEQQGYFQYEHQQQQLAAAAAGYSGLAGPGALAQGYHYQQVWAGLHGDASAAGRASLLPVLLGCMA
jgi:hypothetical protein